MKEVVTGLGVCGPSVIAWRYSQGSPVWRAIRKLAGSALTTVKDFFAGIDWAGIGEKIKHVADNIKDFAEGVKNGAHDDAGTMFVKLGDKAHEAAGKIEDLGRPWAARPPSCSRSGAPT